MVAGKADVCVADGLVTSEAPEPRVVLADAEAECDVEPWPADALVVGHGVWEADAPADADALCVPGAVSFGSADADGPVAPVDALAEPEPPEEGVPDPEHAAGEEVSAIPEVAGITSKAPIATVPVATAPATEAADRPLLACLGTVLAPN